MEEPEETFTIVIRYDSSKFENYDTTFEAHKEQIEEDCRQMFPRADIEFTNHPPPASREDYVIDAHIKEIDVDREDDERVKKWGEAESEVIEDEIYNNYTTYDNKQFEKITRGRREEDWQ